MTPSGNATNTAQERFTRNMSPTKLETHATTNRLPFGELLTIRPLAPDDSARFGEYLCGLSEQTRSLYGPHAFDQETADAICAALDPSDILRMTASVPRAGRERTIAYMLLKLGVLADDAQRYERLSIALNPLLDATLAPSVADDYQSRGVGSLVMKHLLHVATVLGRKRIVLWGGVQARNARAVNFYTKWGFRKVGEFYAHGLDNFDMILEMPE